jgi:hypothetical protein
MGVRCGMGNRTTGIGDDRTLMGLVVFRLAVLSASNAVSAADNMQSKPASVSVRQPIPAFCGTWRPLSDSRNNAR